MADVRELDHLEASLGDCVRFAAPPVPSPVKVERVVARARELAVPKGSAASDRSHRLRWSTRRRIVTTIVVAALGAGLASGAYAAVSALGVRGLTGPANSGQGIALQEAVSKMGRNAPLPDTSVVGDPTGAQLDELAKADKGSYGLLVGYSSGLNLTVEPGSTDLMALEARSTARFTDGRTKDFELIADGGRTYAVSPGGTQDLGPLGTNVVRPHLVFDLDDMTYTLTATSGSLTLDDLMNAARTIR